VELHLSVFFILGQQTYRFILIYRGKSAREAENYLYVNFPDKLP